MRRFLAENYLDLVHQLVELDVRLRSIGDHAPPEAKVFPHNLREGFAEVLAKITTTAFHLNFGRAVALGRRTAQELDREECTFTDLAWRVRQIREDIEDTARSRVYFEIPAERVPFLLQVGPDGQHLPFYGQPVYEALPSARFDIEEAAKSFACDRPTAAVFHALRACEVGLRVIGKHVGVELRASSNWQVVIDQIKKKIDSEREGPEKAMIAGFVSHLQAIKSAWRNEAMHVGRHYTEEAAFDILMRIGALLRHLATELREDCEQH